MSNAHGGMIIDGIFASETPDSSGEIISVEGCDITDLKNGTSILNFEHRGAESNGHSALDIIGKILTAKKIFKQEDCENDRERMYWNEVKVPFIYGQARLYDGAGHPAAMAAAAMIRDHASNGEKVLLRYSIEGSTLDRKDHLLLKTVARRVAATIKPCNRSCDSGILVDPQAKSAPQNVEVLAEKLLGQKKEESAKKFEAFHPGYVKLGSSPEFEYTEMAKADAVENKPFAYHLTWQGALPSIARGGIMPQKDTMEAWGNPSGVYFVNKFGHQAGPVWGESSAWLRFPWPTDVKHNPYDDRTSEYRSDLTAHPKDVEVWVDSENHPVSHHDEGTWKPLHSVVGLKKADAVGNANAAPSTLTGHAALQREELHGRKKKLFKEKLKEYIIKKAKEAADKKPAKETESSWSGDKPLNDGLPDVSDKFLDTFEDVTEGIDKIGPKKVKKAEVYFNQLATINALRKEEKKLDSLIEGVPSGAMGWTQNGEGKPVIVKSADKAGPEAATYELAKMFGVGDYLPHVVVDPKSKKVVIQGVDVHHPEMLSHGKRVQIYKGQKPEDIQKVVILDAISKNHDRFFGGHGFKDGKMVFLDHGNAFAPENYQNRSLAPSYLAHVHSVTTPEVATWVQGIDSSKVLDMLKKHGVVKDDAHAKDIVEHIEDVKANVKPNYDLKLLFDGRG